MSGKQGVASGVNPPIIVIFGITGDLAQRYLLPALYHLMKDGLLDERTEIVGISRRDITAEQLLTQVDLCVHDTDKICDPVILEALHQRTRMIQMDLGDPAAYTGLLKMLNAIEEQKGVCLNRLYYLSIPPQFYLPVVRLMGEAGLNGSCEHGRAETRLMVEKPFGFDLTSAEALITETAKVFEEEQTFRIDHFLAKETVQNLLTFRFKNPIFGSLWGSQHIASIDINAYEQIGIEKRAEFYESLGALRDFIQNHLLQLTALITMDAPAVLDSDHIHAAKQQVLEKIQPGQVTNALRGQYEGYRAEVGNLRSTTETYAALTISINSDRWQGVPINLRTGKAMAEKNYEIIITFHARSDPSVPHNRLRFRLQPAEGIELELLTKKPGFEDELQTVSMGFDYEQHFDDHKHPNAYERVILDAIRGDHTLFTTSGEVLASWQIIQPVLDAWAKTGGDLQFYAPGQKGALARP